MSVWEHVICDLCWVELKGTRPAVTAPPELETCCWCGEDTYSGIYIREDPAVVPHPKGSAHD